jgi:hypothetical protein
MRSSGVASLAAIVGEFRIWEEIRILDWPLSLPFENSIKSIRR